MRVVVFGVALLVLQCACAAPEYNILFLMADQFRWDMIGAWGNPFVSTPNLDYLAKQGLLFNSMYSATPSCTPARSAILTGLSPWYHGMLGYGDVAPRYAYEMPRALSEAGYLTASIGKDHFGWNVTTNTGISHGYESVSIYDGLGDGLPDSNDTNGFDTYDQYFQTVLPGQNPLATGLDWNTWYGKTYVFPEEYHPTAWTGRAATEFITNYNDSRPFFLKVSFHRPHSPYDPPARVYNETTTEFPPMAVGDEWDNVFTGQPGEPPGCMGVDAWCGLMPVADTNVSRRAYYASVAFVDEWIGSIIGALNETGHADNTFIIFTSDHGDMQGDHYHWRKSYPYEGSGHVPMIVSWPENFPDVNIERGSTTDAVAELRDIFPTFLAVAGVEPASTLNGTSMTCLLSDPTGASCNLREYIDMEHDVCYNYTNHWSALTDGKVKYIFNADFPQEQLFNLTADPGENNDLANLTEYQDLLLLWRGRLVAQFEREGRGPTWVVNGTLQQRRNSQLYSLNYPVAPVYLGAYVFGQDCAAASSFFQTWVINGSNSLIMCNDPAVPDGVSSLAFHDAAPGNTVKLIETKKVSSCPADETFCATAFDLSIGANVTLGHCQGLPTQEFVYNATSGFIQQPASELCLTLGPNNMAVFDTCIPNNIDQVWTYSNNHIVPTTSPEGLCLTANQDW